MLFPYITDLLNIFAFFTSWWHYILNKNQHPPQKETRWLSHLYLIYSNVKTDDNPSNITLYNFLKYDWI